MPIQMIGGDVDADFARARANEIHGFSYLCRLWQKARENRILDELVPFFAAAHRALKPGGQLGFVVHRENSPREALEIFGELVAEDPTVLQKQVAFDFPRDTDHVRTLLQGAGFEIRALWQDSIVFQYRSPEQVLEHLLKSGAGTAFHDAIDPARRPVLTERFLRTLALRHAPGTEIEVRHDYVACVANRAA